MAATEKHLKQVGRLDMLQKRIHLLEKDCSKDNLTFCGALGSCVWDIARSIPFIPIAAFIMSISGLQMMIQSRAQVTEGIQKLHMSEQLEEISADILVVCTAAIVIDIVVLISSFPAQGAVREWIFGRDHQNCMLCIVCLIGPCMMGLFEVLLLVLFLAMFFIALLVVPVATILNVANAGCAMGKFAQTGVGHVLAGTMGVKDTLILTSMEDICSGDHAALTNAGSIFTGGVVLAALGQALLLITNTDNWEKVVNQQDYDVGEDEEKEILHNYYQAQQDSKDSK